MGVVWLVVVPSPNCPELFEPQAQRLPSDPRYKLWEYPAVRRRPTAAVTMASLE